MGKRKTSRNGYRALKTSGAGHFLTVSPPLSSMLNVTISSMNMEGSSSVCRHLISIAFSALGLLMVEL
jgi:hypothetical protein